MNRWLIITNTCPNSLPHSLCVYVYVLYYVCVLCMYCSVYMSVLYICIVLCGNVCLYNSCIVYQCMCVCVCVCVCMYTHTHFFKMMHSIQFYKQLYTGNAKYVYLRKQLTDADFRWTVHQAGALPLGHNTSLGCGHGKT